jgi:hypothetical protein
MGREEMTGTWWVKIDVLTYNSVGALMVAAKIVEFINERSF